jgi:hypothetical protein
MKAIGSIMPKPKMPSTSPVPAPAAMPDPGDPGLKMAARKKIEERRAKGREGTIYTNPNYSNQNLGGTQ